MAFDRVVALVDMDCFYVQVEQRLNPSLYGKPCAVVQYNHWKGGGIIAVGYEARKYGVTRNMRGDEAKEKCPDIILARVPEARGKADLTRYREAGAEVLEVLQTFSDVCERASVDEAYLDLTERVERSLETISLDQLADQTLKYCHVIGFTGQTSCDTHTIRGQWLAALSNKHNKHLAMGALIIQKAREAIKKETGFTCSAGIAHNKVLAKLAAGTHKPNQQTLLPQQSVATFFHTVPIRKVRYFGGKFGQSVMNLLQVENMAELTKFSKEELKKLLGEKSSLWLYQVCRGVEHEIVRPRQLAKSTGCGKNFLGPAKLATKERVCYWMTQLADELCDRLKGERDKNQRTAKLVSVGLRTEDNTSGVRSFPLRNMNSQSICESAMQVIKNFNLGTGDSWHPGIISLNMSASKFEEISEAQSSSSIASFFEKKEKNITNSFEVDNRKNVAASKSADLVSQTVSLAPNTSVPDVLESTEKEHGKNAGFDSLLRRTQGSLPCAESATTYDEPTTFGYIPGEINQSIVDELPDDIRQEIELFLGVQRSSTQTKRCNSGIEKYTFFKNCTSTTQGSHTETNAVSPKNNNKDNSSSGTTINSCAVASSEKRKLIKCARCDQSVEQFKMREHMDFHFAMDLHESDQRSDCSEEPPRKRQKSTITSFFVSKDR